MDMLDGIEELPMSTTAKCPWISAKEAADILVCSPGTIWNLQQAGLILARQTRFRRRYDRASVERLAVQKNKIERVRPAPARPAKGA
jgi:hypothetical protein